MLTVFLPRWFCGMMQVGLVPDDTRRPETLWPNLAERRW